jgi:hypothetical protein
MDVQEETSGTTRMHQWNKGWRLIGTTMSEEGEDIQQDLQEDGRAGGRKENCRNFHYPAETE